ncbi:DUF1524 domain-containing protein [Kitasatospora sp. MAP5-34]|uniref:GmrSD restriction endonuclease domain-containing protein n=1 Tax=Kitasatospora sp. MAP5-34 TaxID=3035102 RepID=UPI0032AEEFA9
MEHVLPQHPAQAWYEQLATETEDGQTPEDLHKALVHTLGNLTLTSENARLSNHPFRRKQEILEGSALLMNQEIAAAPGWGSAEIHQRGQALADRAVSMWPGPGQETSRRAAAEEWSGWADVRAALIAMPAGTWTTYGDIAELIGSHAVPVGNFLAGRAGVLNAYRVLNASGQVSPAFRWADGTNPGDPREIMAAEGVPFDGNGRAHPSHRLSAEDLAALLGRNLSDSEPPALHGNDAASGATAVRERANRFTELLRTNRPDTADAVLALLRSWEDMGQGCRLEYGRATETSCFLMVDREITSGSRTVWPFAIYPVFGTVEVVFQHMRTRAPFDSPQLRQEFLQRLNRIEGINLAEAKLELRPSFPLEILASQANEIREALTWFVGIATGQLTA